MIGFIQGTLTDLDYLHSKAIVLTSAGVGYLISLNLQLLNQLSLHQEVQFFIQPEIREDTFDLIGFQSSQEKYFYKKLRSVNGVGPKTALNIMSIPLDDLTNAIEFSDIKLLSSINGLGKKTAERLILELRGSLEAVSSPTTPNSSTHIVEALESFGYRKPQILETLKTVPENLTEEQEIVKLCLRILGSKT